MSTNTYVALDKITVGTATSSVTFSSIASTYTDLVLVTSIQRTASGNTRVRFNGDTATNYSTTYIEGNGTAASSSRNTNQTYMTLDYSNSTSNWVPSIAHIMNYANTTTNKTMINRTGDAGVVVLAYAQLWRSTAAITSLTLVSDTTFAVGTTFSLYGIASSAVGAKATGGIITSDANYYYHTFLASGTFTPTQSITADCLVVAGGGGSGANWGGGGGAGGVLAFTSQSFTVGSYTATVGGGGSAGTGSGNGTAGVNSTFGSLTTCVGGGYGAGSVNVGGNGGSGGGGASAGGSAQAGGTATSGQGFAGGTSNPNPGAGGGGSGAVGGNSVGGGAAGAGGAGLNTWSSWLSATGLGVLGFIAGGGGGGTNGTGGTGGSGGGGAGSGTAGGAGTAGTVNTGSGAGGGATSNGSGNTGGSGLIIVRYAK